jgi:aminoglycoside 6'-N-acetyltransferase
LEESIMPPQLTLRPAAPRDIALLRRWDEEPHVVAADPNDDWDWEHELMRNPGWREQLIAEVDGMPMGFVQIIDPLLEDSHYWGEIEPNLRAIDIWIGEEAWLGKGFGTEMMRQALAKCFAAPEVTAVLIDPLASNVASHRFYERLGFERVGPRRFGLDDCIVFRLDRQRWSARSP